MDTKDKIIDVTENLFNEFGYNGISMRDIADKLGISVGNLTYHYKRKEDLVEAVVIRQHEQYYIKKPAENLEQLNDLFVRMLFFQRKKGYYFRHYKQLSQVSEKINEIQSEVMQDLLHIFLQTLQNFNKKNILKDEMFPGQYMYTVQTILSVIIYGIPLSDTCRNRVENRINCLWSILFPLLTNDGLKNYSIVLQKNKELEKRKEKTNDKTNMESLRRV